MAKKKRKHKLSVVFSRNIGGKLHLSICRGFKLFSPIYFQLYYQDIYFIKQLVIVTCNKYYAIDFIKSSQGPYFVTIKKNKNETSLKPRY